MKRIFTFVALLMMSFALPSEASAQFDLSKALGMLFGGMQQNSEQSQTTTKPQQQVTVKTPLQLIAETAPTLRDIQGRWTYSSADAEYVGDNPLAQMAISQVKPIAIQQIESTGITPGSFTLTLKRNGVGTLQMGDHTLTGNYTYNASTAELLITGAVNNVAVSCRGYVKLADGKLTVLIDANDALKAFTSAFPQYAMHQTVLMVSGVIQGFPGVCAAATFTK